MTFLRFLFISVVTACCVRADGSNPMAGKCAGIQGKIGQTCSPTACANRNTSCPLIPEVLCASDECGCHAAFFALVNQTGRVTRIDVTDLCRATVEIKDASDLMERLLVGDVETRDLVASDPDVLFRVFNGLNHLSLSQLVSWVQTPGAKDPNPAMQKRQQFLESELAALEERMRRRQLDDVTTAVTRVGNVSEASSKEAEKELRRRKDAIRQWTKEQEQVKILDESVSMYTLIRSARMASRKYAVDNQGSIVGSQMPLYGDILFSFVLMGGGMSYDAFDMDKEKVMLSDSETPGKILGLYSQLKYIVLHEAIARRQLRRNNFRFGLPPVSATSYRVRFNFRSFAPLVRKTDVDPNSVLRLMSLASQTAALGMDLYSNMVGYSPTALASFVEDWNIADDLTEFMF